MRKRGYTLIEILIAIFITTIVMSGITLFLMQVSDSIFQSQSKAKISVALSEFMERTNSLRVRFSSGSIIDASTWYDALLFTNTGSTAGVLVWVVSKVNGNYLLDATGSYSTYGKKILGVQELTQSQIATALSNDGAYSIVFQEDKVYDNLYPKSLSITPFQSGSLFEMELELYDSFNANFVGRPVTTYPWNNDTSKFRLVF